jgi:hypothetical protein
MLILFFLSFFTLKQVLSSLVILEAHLIYQLPCLPTSGCILFQAEGIENHVDHNYSDLFSPPTGMESPVGVDHHRDSDNQALWIQPTGSESPRSSNNDDQPSPVSVLESSLDADEVYSGDFEKISADIQGKWLSFSLPIHLPLFSRLSSLTL